MSYNFSTIDGLFRPNFNVYKPVLESLEVEPPTINPIQITYKPLDIQRVKAIITTEPLYEDTLNDLQSITTSQNESDSLLKDLEPQENLEYFMQELEKFITKNPEYKNIKNSLLYLAALESSYKIDASNVAGSGALGWFLFMDDTRKDYNKQSREQFARDPLALLLTAALHYTKLQREIRAKGGDPNDFVTMYGAWWRPVSAFEYLKNPYYDFKTKYDESFQLIIQRARNLLNKNGKSTG